MMSKRHKQKHMETGDKVSQTSRLFDARNQLRMHLDLETLLLEQTALLPEDCYGTEPRECFQLGAAQAMIDAGPAALFSAIQTETSADMFEMFMTEKPEVIHAFMMTRPYNKYSGEYYFEPSELEAFISAYCLVTQAVSYNSTEDAI